MKRVDCSTNALFKSYGDICCLSWPSSLFDELSMYKSDGNNFFIFIPNLCNILTYSVYSNFIT